jgi:putative spermidine/putrescine transport system substrate-binding protein
MSARPELGITDPYTLDNTQYNAVLDLLRKLRKLVASYWREVSPQLDAFSTGNVVASSAWPFQANLLQAQGKSIATTIPKEGATGWADTTMLSAQAKHPNCAYLWLEHSLAPKVQGDAAAWIGSLPVVPAACTASTLLGKEGCKLNGIDSFDQLHFWRTPLKDCGDSRGAVCIPYSQWVTDYEEIIASN